MENKIKKQYGFVLWTLAKGMWSGSLTRDSYWVSRGLIGFLTEDGPRTYQIRKGEVLPEEGSTVAIHLDRGVVVGFNNI